MRRIGRYAFAVLAWGFVVGVLLQVFFAGIGLFGAGGMRLHIDFGYALPLVPLMMLILLLMAKAGRRTAWLTVALFALGSVIQPTLPLLREMSPLIAALHPPNALLVFWLAVIVGRRSLALLAEERRASTVDAEAEAPI